VSRLRARSQLIFRARRRLPDGQPPNMDLCDAAAGPNDRPVEAPELFVCRDADKQFEPLAQEAVGEVEQTAERLAGRLFGFTADEFVAVLEDEKAPPLVVVSSSPNATDMR
jgi:hypothetical protein